MQRPVFNTAPLLIGIQPRKGLVVTRKEISLPFAQLQGGVGEIGIISGRKQSCWLVLLGREDQSVRGDREDGLCAQPPDFRMAGQAVPGCGPAGT